MKRILFTILLVLGLVSQANAAEFLVHATGHWMDEWPESKVNSLNEDELSMYKSRFREGDICMVRPDGWKWGKQEGLPKFIVVKVPDMSVEEAKVYEKSLYDTTDKPALRQSKYSFDEDEVNTAKSANLKAIVINKSAFDFYRIEKTGDSKEVRQPKSGLFAEAKYWLKPKLDRLDVRRAYAADLEKVIDPSGTEDCTALESCLDANEQDLTDGGGDTITFTIQGDWSSADTTQVSVGGYTTSATNYLSINVVEAARHDGTYDTSAYRVETSQSGGRAFEVSQSHVKLSGVQVKNTYTGTTNFTIALDNFEDNDFLWNKLILWSAATGGTESAGLRSTNGDNIHIANSVIIGYDGAVVWGSFANATNQQFFNSVIIGNGNIGLRQNNDANRDITAQNCYIYGANDSIADPSGDSVYTNTHTNDGENGTTTTAYSTSSGAYFTNVTGGSEDFHITNTSSALFEAGSNLSGTFTDDIDGNTRSAWDVGVDYIQAAAAAGMGWVTVITD